MQQKRLPGPVGTSCLTCKRRRKKCDQGRPTCQRCSEGGYECLGYNHNQRRTVAVVLDSDPSPSSSRAESVEINGSPGHYSVSRSSEFGDRCNDSVDGASNKHLLRENSYHSIVPATDFNIETYDRGIGTSFLATLTSGAVVLGDRQQPFAPRGSSSRDPFLPSSTPSGSSNRPNNDFYTSIVLNHPLDTRTARTLSTLPPDVKHIVNFVLNQYERILDHAYFKPKHEQINQTRALAIERLQASSITRYAIHLGAKILQSVLDGTSSSNRAAFNRALGRFEQTLRLASTQMPKSRAEMEYRLDGFLEATFLKMRLGNGYNAYNLLHGVAPIFLQIVYADPKLWPDANGPPTPCLAHLISSTRFELGHFALMDLTCAMAYGLPQAVSYDTSSPGTIISHNPIEWIHCCPPEFQICLAEINKRCANAYISHDWHLIERRLQAHKPALSQVDGMESWRVIGRLAGIESWRQVLLIYLYMAVCGCASDDIRVRSAVKQVFQLFGTVRRQEPPKVNVHFIFQYLIAGICARSEKERAYIRDRLSDVYENELWLLPGSEFVPVLDHLWHTAAADGRPIKWSDYIRSRQIAHPIPISV